MPIVDSSCQSSARSIAGLPKLFLLMHPSPSSSLQRGLLLTSKPLSVDQSACNIKVISAGMSASDHALAAADLYTLAGAVAIEEMGGESALLQAAC